MNRLEQLNVRAMHLFFDTIGCVVQIGGRDGYYKTLPNERVLYLENHKTSVSLSIHPHQDVASQILEELRHSRGQEPDYLNYHAFDLYYTVKEDTTYFDYLCKDALQRLNKHIKEI